MGGVEEVETDVRIIAACNADLPRYVEEGKFRTDLFYRLNTFPIHIPPLRERREDIPPLCRSLLDELSRKLKRRLELTPEAMDRLLAHNWPGNVRELRNVLEFCAYLTPSGVITELSLPENLRTGPTAQPSLTLAQRTRAFERAEILRLLERNGASLEGKKKTAAPTYRGSYHLVSARLDSNILETRPLSARSLFPRSYLRVGFLRLYPHLPILACRLHISFSTSSVWRGCLK